MNFLSSSTGGTVWSDFGGPVWAVFPGKPHQLDFVTENTPAGAANIAFTYNTSGSLTKMEKTLGSTTQTEDLYWNEEQQLVGVHNGNGLHHYVYDYRGERILKASYTQTGTSINDNPLTGSGSISGYTAYFNPYVVANYAVFPPFQIEEATHHYYMGAQRVASGRFASDANLYEGSSTGPGTPLRQAEDTSSKPNAVLDQLEWLLQQAGYVEGEDYTRESLEQPTPMAELYPGFSGSAQQRSDPPIEDPFEPRQFTEYTFCTPWVTEVYWYHPNYLGSVDLVTDLSGHAHQYFMYTAWGEPMFENSTISGGFDAPFRFNGKELDKETGLGYYGARYYQNRLSTWLSVDPLASQFPNWTPYHFVHNNPIMLIDPNGMSATGPGEPGGNEWPILGPDHYLLPDVEVVTQASVAGPRTAEAQSSMYNYTQIPYLPGYGTGFTRNGSGTAAQNGGGYDWGYAGNVLGAGGTAYAGLGNAVANKYWWMDAKGNYKSTKILQQGANGKYVRGVQGLRNGYNSALKAASGYKVAGNVVGGLGLLVTGAQLYNNQITATEASIDAAFGVIGFFGPIGAGISATYFIGKFGYEYFSGNTVFEKPR
jgi:RHS repeat-associated protein